MHTPPLVRGSVVIRVASLVFGLVLGTPVLSLLGGLGAALTLGLRSGGSGDVCTTLDCGATTLVLNGAPISDIRPFTSDAIRTQLTEVQVYILAQVGMRQEPEAGRVQRIDRLQPP